MNSEINDFIFSIGEFNGCVFCNKFGFRKDCPVKNFPQGNEEPSEQEVMVQAEKCKEYVLKNLKNVLLA